MRLLAVPTMLASVGFALAGCGPSYSPNTYATNAAQQANKVESGVIAGVRKVQITASGTVGGVAGAAAGGVAGSQVGVGPASTFSAIGGSLIGGIAGVATEHIVSDTNGFEYIVRKANGEMISVAQKDDKPLWVGEKVLVIAGPQARIVPDYTVPFDAPDKTAAKPAAPGQPPAADGSTPHPAATATPQIAGNTGCAAERRRPLHRSFASRRLVSPAATPPAVVTPPEALTLVRRRLQLRQIPAGGTAKPRCGCRSGCAGGQGTSSPLSRVRGVDPRSAHRCGPPSIGPRLRTENPCPVDRTPHGAEVMSRTLPRSTP